MSDKQKKDPTKSIAWKTLNKETQEKLIGIYSEYMAPNISESKTIGHREQLNMELHTALGVKVGDYKILNRQLTEIVEGNEGGIYNHIKAYLEKYDTIESAIRIIAKERQNGKAIGKLYI